MNKLLLVIAVLIALAVIGGGVYYANHQLLPGWVSVS